MTQRGELTYSLEEESISITVGSLEQTVNELARIATAYRVTPLKVAKYKEEFLRNALTDARHFQRNLTDIFFAVALTVGGVVAVVNSNNPSGVQSGLFFGQLVVAPWCLIVAVFLLLEPKEGAWLKSLANIWWSLLLSVVTTVVALYVQEPAESPQRLVYKNVLHVALYACFAFVFIAFGIRRIGKNEEAMNSKIAKIEHQLETLHKSVILAELSGCQKSMVETVSLASASDLLQQKAIFTKPSKNRSIITMLTSVCHLFSKTEN